MYVYAGNSEGDLTEAALVLRRKEHVQQLCSVYQVEAQAVHA